MSAGLTCILVVSFYSGVFFFLCVCCFCGDFEVDKASERKQKGEALFEEAQ